MEHEVTQYLAAGSKKLNLVRKKKKEEKYNLKIILRGFTLAVCDLNVRHQ